MLKWRRLILQLILLAAIALVSNYRLPDFSQINLQIATFLTPYGMIVILPDSQSTLRSFYFDKTPVQPTLTFLRFLGLVALYFCLLVNCFITIRKLRQQ